MTTPPAAARRPVRRRQRRPAPTPGRASTLALVVLVAIAVIGPWPFGSVQPAVSRALASVALLAGAVALAWGALGERPFAPAVALWPVAALLGLGLIQLAPLPEAVHGWLAAGSHAVWHPSDALAAAVVGGRWRPLTIDPAATVAWLAMAAGLIGLAAAAAPALSRSRDAVTAALVLGGGALAVAVYGVVSHSAFGSMLYGVIAVPTSQPLGPFVSKNHFAGYVASATPLLLGIGLALVDEERSAGRDWTGSPKVVAIAAAFFATLITALAVGFSLSRGGLINLGTGCLAVLGLRWRSERPSPRRALAVVAVLLLAAAGLVGVLPEEARHRIGTLSDGAADPSQRLRLQVWHDSAALVASSPWLGHGYGSFAEALPRFKSAHGELRVEHAENDYVELLAEGGLIGLGLLLAALGVLGAGAIRGAGQTRQPWLRGLSTGALAGLVGLLAHELVDFNLRIPSNAAFAAALASLALAPAGCRPVRRATSTAGLAAAAALAVLLAAYWYATPPAWPLVAEQAQAAAASPASARALRLARADAALHRALAWRPAHAEAWLLLAWTSAARGEGLESSAYARRAASLDPQRRQLVEEARRLLALAEPAPHSGPAAVPEQAADRDEGGAESTPPEAER